MTWTRASLRATVRERLGDSQLVVVSNREPYVHGYEGGAITCEVPVGGVTAALDPILQACGGLWVAHGSGTADREVVDKQDHVRVPPEAPAYTLRRVWLSEDEEAGYYDGFSNRALWPLCHLAYTKPFFAIRDWETYRAVNRKFADVILQEVGDGNAFVFIQDFHFALLSRLLKRPNIRTAQFWHIPWPNPEAFRVCPWAAELLEGLLGNDLLGFHIQYHCQNFLDTVDRLLEAKIDREHSAVIRQGLTTLVRPFPVGVDFEDIARRAASPQVEREIAALRARHRLEGAQVGLGVDRLDYTKGIPERLRAIGRLFEHHPELKRRFVFVEIGVPTRVRLATYKQASREIDELVARINWEHGEGDWRPVIQLTGAVGPTTLLAWYRLAHLCIVSSLHDGMNLVAKEFPAARVKEDGVLVLSPFTGAARELTDAEIINPYDTDELAEVLWRALRMPPEERRRRMQKIRAVLREQNVFRWAARLLSALFAFEFQEA
jgi:trehalose 6-phosphate synthase